MLLSNDPRCIGICPGLLAFGGIGSKSRNKAPARPRRATEGGVPLPRSKPRRVRTQTFDDAWGDEGDRCSVSPFCHCILFECVGGCVRAVTDIRWLSTGGVRRCTPSHQSAHCSIGARHACNEARSSSKHLQNRMCAHSQTPTVGFRCPGFPEHSQTRTVGHYRPGCPRLTCGRVVLNGSCRQGSARSYSAQSSFGSNGFGSSVPLDPSLFEFPGGYDAVLIQSLPSHAECTASVSRCCQHHHETL